MSIRELTPLSVIRSKAKKIENINNFLISGLKPTTTRSIAQSGNAKTETSASHVHASIALHLLLQ